MPIQLVKWMDSFTFCSIIKVFKQSFRSIFFVCWLCCLSVCVYNPIDKKVKMEVLSAKQNGGLLSSVNNRLILTGGTESSHIRQPTNTAWMYIDQVCSHLTILKINSFLILAIKDSKLDSNGTNEKGSLEACFRRVRGYIVRLWWHLVRKSWGNVKRRVLWSTNQWMDHAGAYAQCKVSFNERTFFKQISDQHDSIQCRYGHSMVEMGGLLWAVGGFSMQNRSVDTVDVYDPFAREWDCPFMKVPFPILGAAILRLSDDLKADLVAKSKREI